MKVPSILTKYKSNLGLLCQKLRECLIKLNSCFYLNLNLMCNRTYVTQPFCAKLTLLVPSKVKSTSAFYMYRYRVWYSRR